MFPEEVFNISVYFNLFPSKCFKNSIPGINFVYKLLIIVTDKILTSVGCRIFIEVKINYIMS